MKDLHTSSFLFGLVSGVLLAILVAGGIFAIGMHHRFERNWKGGKEGNGKALYHTSDTQREGSGSDMSEGQ